MDNLVALGLSLLVNNDAYLMRLDVNERSITHKLGEHYSLVFPGWDVDCEFNKNLDGPKKISIEPRTFLNQMADFLDNEISEESLDMPHSILRDPNVNAKDVLNLKKQLRDPDNLIYDEELNLIAFVLSLNKGKKVTKPIFPDIIVHHRGTRDNLVVIEAKKTSNKNQLSRLYDIVKLHILTTDPDYAYRYGYFVDIPTKDDFIPDIRFTITPYRLNPRIQLVTALEHS